jgi:hypothetical protein
MGKLVWHEYARLIALTASIYTVWAGIFGLIYRKFFWDFVGGIVRIPGGIQPSASSAIFVRIIVKTPVVQISSIIMGVMMIVMEYPAPIFQETKIHRSIVIRVPLLLMQAALAILFYQGTNGAIWSVLAAAAYARAVTLGEQMKSEDVDKEGEVRV